MIRRVSVGPLSRAIATKLGRPARYLRPGSHWLFGFGWTVREESVANAFLHPRSDLELEQLSALPEARAELAFVHLREGERALVWLDGRLEHVLSGGPWALWNVRRKLRVEVDQSSLLLDPGVPVDAALACPGASTAFEELVVPLGHVGFVLRDQVVEHELEPGRHVAWRGRSRLEIVPRVPTVLDLAVEDAWTRDLMTVRLEVSLAYRVLDPRRWVESGGQGLARLRAAVEAGVRAVVARHAFARIATDPAAVGLALEAAIGRRVDERCVDVQGASLGRVALVRRLPRPRFRGFGDRGRDVAATQRDFAGRPWAGRGPHVSHGW